MECLPGLHREQHPITKPGRRQLFAAWMPCTEGLRFFDLGDTERLVCQFHHVLVKEKHMSGEFDEGGKGLHLNHKP